MKPHQDDHPLQRLRHEWFMTGGIFLLLIVVAILVILRVPDGREMGLLLGLAAIGTLLFKLGDLVIIAIGELRRRRD